MQAFILQKIGGKRAPASRPSLRSSARMSTPEGHGSTATTVPSSEEDDGKINFVLTSANATLGERREGFAHLKKLASRSGSSDRRQYYYDIIVIPTDHSIVDLQISALDTLTDGGRLIQPFEAELIKFLTFKLKELSNVTERLREGQRANGSKTSVYTPEVSNSAPPVGAEKALMDIFYLVAGIINNHPNAFHDAQLEILLDIVTDIAKTTTMRRTLRGALKIWSAVTTRTKTPEANVRTSVSALCAILGSPTLKFSEDAWQCISILAFDYQEEVGEYLVDHIFSRPDPSQTRSLAKYKGALLSIRRIADEVSRADTLLPHLAALFTGLRRALSIDPFSTLVTMQTIDAILSNDVLAHQLIQEEWDIICHELDKRDEYLFLERETHYSTEAYATISLLSPLYGFVHTDFTTTETLTDPEIRVVLDHVGEQICFLMNDQWQSISKDKAWLAIRVLLHLARYFPELWTSAIGFMWTHDLLNPRKANWQAHLGILVTLIASTPPKPVSAQRLILKSFSRSHSLLHDDNEKFQNYESQLQTLYKALTIGPNMNIEIINSLTDLSLEVCLDIKMTTLEIILDLFEKTSTQASLDSFEAISRSVVQLFLKCFTQSFAKTSRLFKCLMNIADSSWPITARLMAMSLLSRLRCHTDFAIRVISIPASDDLAGNLRTGNSSGVVSAGTATQLHRSSQVESLRTGRSSVQASGTARSRSATRSINAKNQWRRIEPPMWMQSNFVEDIPSLLPAGPSLVTYAQKSDGEDRSNLDLGPWLDLMVRVLSEANDWEIYSYVLVHLPLQLSNCTLLSNQVKLLQILHNTLVVQLNNGDFPEPPKDSGIKKGEVALCLYQILKMLLPYHEESFNRRMTDDTVRTFRMGIEKWERTGKCCIHALALCCYEIPSNIERHINGIIEMMQKRVTQADLAMDILEFLSCLSRLRQAYGTADVGFYRRIFGICIRYLQVAWEQRQTSVEGSKSRVNSQYNRQSGSTGEATRTTEANIYKESQGLSEYVYILAYQTIIIWFLSIDVRERAQHVGWLTQELAWSDESGKQHMEEQSLVVLDMMHRTAYSNLGETVTGSDFLDPSMKVATKMWLVGMSIITTEVASDQTTGMAKCGQLTKRQASGTTHATYYHNTADLPSHHVDEDAEYSNYHTQSPLDVYPNHMFLQLTSTIAPTPLPLQPIPLPDDDFTKRAIRVFDKIDTVDGHKVGVIYIGEGQKTEAETLANDQGSDGYKAFLSGLGTKVPLKDANFNTQGLDHRTNEDGTHTYAWRDRVTEVVFHVATLMPTDLLDDPHADKKKRHIGNDHIKIVFNASGQPFNFDIFATALNTVNIVITPEAHTSGTYPLTDRTEIHKKREPGSKEKPTKTERFGFYCVQTLFSRAYPQFSTAAGRQIISAEVLPDFVRHIAITCSVFCQVWENSIIRDSEYISSWRARLQEIIRLRKRFANTNVSANVHYPMSGAETTLQYSEGSAWTGTATLGGMADADKLLNSLDFTRWT